MRRYFVICRTDREFDGEKGRYVMATSRQFSDRESAEKYARGVAKGREPLVLVTVEEE